MAEQALIDSGKKIVDELRKDVPISFAVWYLDPTSQSTYLGIGSKKFDEIGPKESYKKILEVVASIKNGLTLFKEDYLKLISLESDLGKTLSSSFSNKQGDTSIGMFVTPNLILHQVYAYGLGS